jgi:FixJ family two-component response regulator
MNHDKPFVYVVDDDSSMRDSLRNLISSTGRNVLAFASAQEFLSSTRPQARSCLVLDVHLPGLSGLDLQQELVRADIQIPIIFISGHGDIPMTVRAMKAGAVEFLTKPIRDEDLLNAVDEATDRDCLIDQSKSKPADWMTGQENLPLREDRFPVFEELTDSYDNVERVADICAGLNSLERVEILPFHQLGRYKWAKLGIDYTLETQNDRRQSSPSVSANSSATVGLRSTEGRH